MLLLVSLVTMLWTGGPAEPQAVAQTDEMTRAQKALDAYQSMNMLEAASVFEGLWTDFRVPGYLFNAALARERLGHEAHAYLNLREYLTARLSADEKEAAERRLQELKMRAVPLRVELVGGDVQGLRLTAQKQADGKVLEIEEPLVAVPGVVGVYELYVEAGEWRVTASAPGYRDAEAATGVTPGSPAKLQLRLQASAVVYALAVNPPAALAAGATIRFTPKIGGQPVTRTIAAGQNEWQLAPGAYAVTVTARGFEPSSFDIDLQSGTVPPTALSLIPLVIPTADDHEVDRRFTLGLGLTSGVLLVSGGVIAAVSTPRFGTVRDDYLAISAQVPENYSGRQWSDAYFTMRQNVRVQTAGFVLAGGGAGAGIATALTRLKNRRRVVAAEVGVGAVALIGSLVAYAVVRGHLNNNIQADEQVILKYDHKDRPRPRTDISSTHTSLTSGVAGSDAAAFFIGAGGALLTAGAVEWALKSRSRTRPAVTVGTTAGRHGGMLTISGNF